MEPRYIKNEVSGDITVRGKTIPEGQYYLIPEVDLPVWANDADVINKIMNQSVVMAKSSDEQQDFLNPVDGLNYLKRLDSSPVTITEQADPPPFAAPTFRTKKDATDAKQTCDPNALKEIDYKMLEERYVSGGGILIVNAQPGDYLTASVYDKDGVIPEAYRPALCEAWPIVAEYLPKQWVPATSDKVYQYINTYPLNAKITPGLYLRITYHAVDEGIARDIYVNYDLTKRL